MALGGGVSWRRVVDLEAAEELVELGGEGLGLPLGEIEDVLLGDLAPEHVARLDLPGVVQGHGAQQFARRFHYTVGLRSHRGAPAHGRGVSGGQSEGRCESAYGRPYRLGKTEAILRLRFLIRDRRIEVGCNLPKFVSTKRLKERVNRILHLVDRAKLNGGGGLTNAS